MTSLPPNPRKRGDNKESDSLHSPRRAGGRGRAFFLGTSLTLALTGLGVAQTKQKAKPALAKSVRLTGPQLFAAQCAPCHGAKGEGGVGYSKALIGSQTTRELASFLNKTMPPGPKHIAAADASLVAAFMQDAFYSPLAQERNRPARVSLSRLTARQFKSAVADLVGSFRGSANLGVERGLKAEYFKAKRFNNNERVLQRTDAQVVFDFGTAGPTADQFEPHQFSIRWEGSLVAPDTGEYELVVRSDHAVQLWVNDSKKSLIDAWIKSGKDTEFRAPIYLLGGRTYPIRLEFSKSTVGVDDTKKKEGKPAPPAFVTLAWKRPHLTDEPIPSRCLVPISVPETFLVNTFFPPEDRSMGYERSSMVSKAWDEAVTNAALETAQFVASRKWGMDEKLFARTFVERAFRRKLTDPEVERYVTRHFTQAPDTEAALKRVVLLTLKSPFFLYRENNTASKLALTLWDSLPDEALLKADLATPEAVRTQAEKMLTDPRAWSKMREFLLTWLKVDAYPDLEKDKKRFPDFDAAAASDLRTSLELFLENTAWGEKSDFRELLLSDKVYLNGRLAKVYGASLSSDASFQPVSLDGRERAGVFTQPYVLASFAYLGTSSPIHRGVLLARNVLGRTLAPPPIAVTPAAAELQPKLTTRQRVSIQTKPAACVTCHNMINPLGFSLERFDAIGRLRQKENEQVIDATGTYQTRKGPVAKFNGARELAEFLASSEEVHATFVERLFQYTTKQSIRAYGPKTSLELQKRFVESGFNIKKLLVEIAVVASAGS
ncbi:DUF1592 domain-containing protein [Armatimonas sp.]|uniref:DUF1592 domain-containing protein n=1 Tax=Armatimonas sp. TaxID=1872638 RepID=UPI0037501305